MQIFLPPKKRKVKLDKVREGLRPITLRFRANAQKLILGSIGTPPLDHLSVKTVKSLHKWLNCHLNSETTFVNVKSPYKCLNPLKIVKLLQ